MVITDSSSLYLYGLSLIAQQQAANTSYYHQDALGSVRNLTDGSGSLTMSYGYDPFGQSTYTSGTANNPFRYTGQYLDNQTGLYYLRARYYQPASGRFVTRDSFQGRLNQPQSLHAYAYAYNNPLVNADPSGYDPKDWFNDQWLEDFENHNGRLPAGNDYAQRFVTMLWATGWVEQELAGEPEALSRLNPNFDVPACADFENNMATARQRGFLYEDGRLLRSPQGLDPFEFAIGPFKIFNPAHNASLLDFANHVRPGGIWDYKNVNETGQFQLKYADYGNFHFGAVARAWGFSEEDTLRGAGAAQWAWDAARWASGAANRNPIEPTMEPGGPGVFGPFYGDHPEDQVMAKAGYYFYGLWARELTEQDKKAKTRAGW